MDSDPRRGDESSTKGPPRGVERWKQETKSIERVIDVALTLAEPRTAGWIAEEAHVSEQTAREHLDLLADLGVVTATTARGVTKYQPDAAWLRFQEVSAMVEEHSREELLDHVEDHQRRIQDAKERYGVDSPDALRAKAAEGDATVEEVREYRQAASEWATLEHELDTLREALDRYDEFDRASATA